MTGQWPVASGGVAAVVLGLLVGQAQTALHRPDAAPTPRAVAIAAYDRMTPAQRVGQLFMAAMPTTGGSAAQITVLRSHDIGNVILVNSTTASRATVRAGTKTLASNLTETGVAPFISTDQEGGEVQRLSGPGFPIMPTALVQGTMTATALRSAATTWGKDLAAAGVNLNLAPVADTVPAKHASQNQPIGQYDREYGHSARVVAPHVVAFLQGMNAGGVDTTVKHFPGLGRATGNTDTTLHVTDPTTRHSAYLIPFTDAIKAGTQFVMVSSATYPKIDPKHLACFSRTIVTGMLRGDLAFHGVVISDDLGTVALSHVALSTRALDFFTAGGTMLLDSEPNQIPKMLHAVVVKAAATPSFAAVIKAAEMNVLLAKARAHLIKS
jgi:beta-N-acetylhexosaminidase